MAITCSLRNLCLLAVVSTAQADPTIQETFATDPLADNRFTQQVAGTESSFVHIPTNQHIQAILDVDSSSAFYLSAPFPPLTELDNSSFSFRLHIAALDERSPPTAFFGLLTATHVEAFGDGLTLSLSSSNGIPLATANIDASETKAAGVNIALSLHTDYLVLGFYTASNRQFTVEIFGGTNFASSIGLSTAILPPDHTFHLDRLGLQNGGARVTDQFVGSLTVLLDDLFTPGQAPVSLDAPDIVLSEGDDGATTNATFNVHLSRPSPNEVTVQFTTQPQSASQGEDFVFQAGQLTFPPGTTDRALSVPVLGDNRVEPDETFRVLLSQPVNALLTTPTLTATILDDDQPLITVEPLALMESDHNTQAVVTVRLNMPGRQLIAVDFTTTNLTAQAPQDYVPAAGTLIFPPGLATQTVTVEVVGDTTFEPDEALHLVLSRPVNAQIAFPEAQILILNDDPLPTLSVADMAVTETDEGTTNLLFSLLLSNPSADPITLSYATSDQTALAGLDYLLAAGSVCFPPGSTQQPVQVAILGDRITEPDETFLLTLAAPTNALLSTQSASGTILNDDPTPTVRIEPTQIPEGDTGTTNALFSVRLSNPSSLPVTVAYQSADATATADLDYLPAGGLLSFPAGSTQTVISVTILGDEFTEPDETFLLNLTLPINATLVQTQATGTILNDDGGTARIRIADASVREGNSGLADLIFTVTLSPSVSETVRVDFTTANLTATAGLDYLQTNGTLTFPPGVTSQIVAVQVNGDLLDEPDETLLLLLGNALHGLILDAQALGTILDDDPPTLLLTDIQVTEGNSGTASASFNLRLSKPASETVSVSFHTADATALAGADYTSTNGIVQFDPGQTNLSITVLVLGDTVDETDETFRLCLTQPVHATLDPDPCAVGTILDDDQPPYLTIDNATTTEPASSTIQVPMTVRLSTPSEQIVTVDFVDLEATATTNDYHVSPGTLTFLPGQTLQTIPVGVLPDNLDEPDECFLMLLINPRNAGFPNGSNTLSGTFTIQDDDPPEVQVSNPAVVEGHSGTTNLVFVLVLSSPPPGEVTLQFTTADGTANAGEDYLPTNGMVVFPTGVLTQTVSITVLGDLKFEESETVQLILTNSIQATLANPRAIGTIINDDVPPEIRVQDAQVQEGDQAQTQLLLTLTLSAPSQRPVSVAYATADQTALAGSDYLAASGTLTFPPGTNLLTLSLQVVGDLLDEPAETFLLRLTSATNAIIATPAATITILDDDPPCLFLGDTQIVEGHEGFTNAILTLWLSSPATDEVAVDFFTTDGSALAGHDYLAQTGRVTFAVGTTNASLAIPVLGDLLEETHETLSVVLANLTNATLCRAQAQVTILDDDRTLILVTDVQLAEGDTGTTNALFQVYLSRPSSQTVSVHYATADLAAQAHTDYQPASGLLTFIPGQTNLTVAVPVYGDTLTEADESFTLELDLPENATIEETRGRAVILNDDPLPVINASPIQIVEGNTDLGTALFTLTLSRPSDQSVTVDFTTLNGTALADQDYLPISGTLSFDPGQTNLTIPVTVLGDIICELNETFFLNLSPPTNATLSLASIQADIQDDDPMPFLTLEGVTLREGDFNTSIAEFVVRLVGASSQEVSVGYLTLNNTASHGADYRRSGGVLSFPPGLDPRAKTIGIVILGDLTPENDETFFVILTNAVNATLNDTVATGTILNDDGIQITIQDVTATEGNSNPTPFAFTVSLSAAASRDITVHYTTADLTATAGLDYTRTDGLLLFPPGTTNLVIPVPVLGDSLDEPDETFLVNLSQPTNADLANTNALGTILDNDPPCLSINDVTVAGNLGGYTNALFSLTLSSPGLLEIQVHYATADGTAVLGTDYRGSSEVLSFPPGVTNLLLPIQVNGNTLDESTEFFFVDLFAPTNATLCDHRGIATIINLTLSNDPPTVTLIQPGACFNLPTNVTLQAHASDPDGLVAKVEFFAGNIKLGEATGGPYTFLWVNPPPGQHTLYAVVTDNLGLTTNSAPVTLTIFPESLLSVSSIQVAEPDRDTNPALFHVLLSAPSCQTVSVAYAIAPGTATADIDYLTLPPGVLVFEPGQTNLNVAVPVLPDTVDEPDETFFLNLSSATNAAILSTNGTATIVDDDPPPTLSISDVAVTEGPADTTVNAHFVLTLSTPSALTVSVDFTTANGSALAGQDYTPASGTITFNPGQTTLNLPVSVLGDNLDEPTEQFHLSLSNGLNVVLADSQAVGTILDDDPPPILSINNITVTEGPAASTTNANFIFTLSNPSAMAISVDYATADGSALAGQDYTPAAGTLIFNPGQTNLTVPVLVLGDDLDELTEILFLNLSKPINVVLGNSQAIGTILDDDSAPTLFISNVTVTEGPAGSTTNASFSLTLSAPSTLAISVDYATTDSSALAGQDYTPASGTLIFNPGQTNLTIPVSVLGDNLDESTEAFHFNLSNPLNVVPAGSRAVGTILDDDPAPTLYLNVTTVIEGPAHTSTNALFRLTLSAPSALAISVDYTTANGSALAGQDYTPASGTVTFDPGQTSLIIPITVLGDNLDEPSELFFLNLSQSLNALLFRDHAPGLILDDDPPPTLSITDVTVTEGAAGSTTNASFVLTLSAPSAMAISVDYATADGSALAAQDYTPASGTVIFNPGQTNLVVPVPVLGDSLRESSETFWLVLTNSSNVVINNPKARSTILDDDPNVPPAVTVTSPADGAAFLAPAIIPLTALATDADGTVQRVDFYAGTILLGTVRQGVGNLYQLLWTNDAAGSYTLTARATDNEAAHATSVPVGILLTNRAIADVAIVRNFDHAEIDRMQDYLAEIELTSDVFIQEGLSFDVLRQYKLVIWDDLGGLVDGLSASDVTVFDQLFQTGIPLYFIGEHLASALSTLPEPQRSQWQNLIHLLPATSTAAPGTVTIMAETSHPAINGPFGTVVDFPYFTALDLTVPTQTGELLLGQLGASGVLLAAEAASAVRTVTQDFLVLVSVNGCAVVERKKLFKNTVWWLLRKPPPPPMRNLFLLTEQSKASVRVGEILTYTNTVTHNGELGASGITLANNLPPSVRFLSATASQGFCLNLCDVITCELGALSESREVIVTITVQTLQPGTLTNLATITANEGEARTSDNLFSLQTQVLGSPVQLLAERTQTGTVQIVLLAQPGQTCLVEFSLDLVAWQLLQRVTPSQDRTLIPDGTAASQPQRFYRARLE